MSYDDYEIDEEPCVLCGGETRRRHCDNFGCEDGLIDMYEEDPMWYDEGEFEACPDCHGLGNFWWCAQCGANQHIERAKAERKAKPEVKNE